MNSRLRLARTEPPRRLRHRATWLLNWVGMVSQRLVTEAVGGAGERAGYAVLASLEEFGPGSQAALGRRLGIDRSDVVATLNLLEGRGLVVRTPDAADRRRNEVTLTPAGLVALVELDHALDRAQDALLEPLDLRERERFVRLLQRVLEHHGVVVDSAPASTVPHRAPA